MIRGIVVVAALAVLAAFAWNKHTAGQAVLPGTGTAGVIVLCMLAGGVLAVSLGRRHSRLAWQPAVRKGKRGGLRRDG